MSGGDSDDEFFEAVEDFTPQQPAVHTEQKKQPDASVAIPKPMAAPMMQQRSNANASSLNDMPTPSPAIYTGGNNANKQASRPDALTPPTASSSEEHLPDFIHGVGASAVQEPRKKSTNAKDEDIDDIRFLVKNLDTGETFNINDAEAKVEHGIDPLSLHLEKSQPAPAEDKKGKADDDKNKKDKDKDKGKKGWFSKHFHKDDSDSSGEEDGEEDNDRGSIPLPPNHVPSKGHKRHDLHFTHLSLIQELKENHVGAVWAMKFNKDGQYLATGGQDMVVRIWALYDGSDDVQAVAHTTPSQTSDTTSVRMSIDGRKSVDGSKSSRMLHSGSAVPRPATLESLGTGTPTEESNVPEEWNGIITPYFNRKPYRSLHGHTSDILDLAWSKDDRYFLSGSLDKILRIWSIPEKKVTHWVETRELITAATFSADAKVAIEGSYAGICSFYDTEVRSTRGKNVGKKITGIQVSADGDNILITSNDSRIRMYSLKDYSMVCKYKGTENTRSQIRASYSADGKYIICGSEDGGVYVWETENRYSAPLNRYSLRGTRKDRNESSEHFQAHEKMSTAAIFAPRRPPAPVSPGSTKSPGSRKTESTPKIPEEEPTPPAFTPEELKKMRENAVATVTVPDNPADDMVIVVASFNGSIRVYRNFVKESYVQASIAKQKAKRKTNATPVMQ